MGIIMSPSLDELSVNATDLNKEVLNNFYNCYTTIKTVLNESKASTDYCYYVVKYC